MIMRRWAVLVAGALMVAGCGSDSATSQASGEAAGGLSAEALITYQFLDSSVPPQYHRSYELTITAKESRIIVDSYGDILADEKVPTDPAVWSTLGSTVDQISSLEAVSSEQGCTGGTATSVAVIEGDDVLADLMLDECAGANAEASEAVDAWIAPARAQFPAMDVLAPEG
jgi:hypothetical protein